MTTNEKIETHHRLISRRKFLGAAVATAGAVVTKKGLDNFALETGGSGGGIDTLRGLREVDSGLSPADQDVLFYSRNISKFKSGPVQGLTNFQHALLSAQHTDTVPATPLAGSIIRGASSPNTFKWEHLGLGTPGFTLRSFGGQASWGTHARPAHSTPYVKAIDMILTPQFTPVASEVSVGNSATPIVTSSNASIPSTERWQLVPTTFAAYVRTADLADRNLSLWWAFDSNDDGITEQHSGTFKVLVKTGADREYIAMGLSFRDLDDLFFYNNGLTNLSGVFAQVEGSVAEAGGTVLLGQAHFGMVASKRET